MTSTEAERLWQELKQQRESHTELRIVVAKLGGSIDALNETIGELREDIRCERKSVADLSISDAELAARMDAMQAEVRRRSLRPKSEPPDPVKKFRQWATVGVGMALFGIVVAWLRSCGIDVPVK